MWITPRSLYHDSYSAAPKPPQVVVLSSSDHTPGLKCVDSTGHVLVQLLQQQVICILPQQQPISRQQLWLSANSGHLLYQKQQPPGCSMSRFKYPPLSTLRKGEHGPNFTWGTKTHDFHALHAVEGSKHRYSSTPTLSTSSDHDINKKMPLFFLSHTQQQVLVHTRTVAS